jgi:hypothetical protein
MPPRPVVIHTGPIAPCFDSAWDRFPTSARVRHNFPASGLSWRFGSINLSGLFCSASFSWMFLSPFCILHTLPWPTQRQQLEYSDDSTCRVECEMEFSRLSSQRPPSFANKECMIEKEEVANSVVQTRLAKLVTTHMPRQIMLPPKSCATSCQRQSI